MHGPMDYAKNAETAIACRGPGPARKKKEVHQVDEGRSKKMRRCALAQSSRVELT